MLEEEYYALRESGTRFDQAASPPFEVVILINEKMCRSAVGQSIALNLVNITLRFIRRLTVILPIDDTELLVRFPHSASSFKECLTRTAHQADPRAAFAIVRTCAAHQVRGYSIALGIGGATKADLYLSADGYIGESATHALSDGGNPRSLVGAGIAALLGAANIARAISGKGSLTVRLSGWNLKTDGEAEAGPAEWEVLQLGLARIIGAGAVGAGLAYWLFQWGAAGDWEVIDRDIVRLKNTSKTLAFLTEDAVELSGQAKTKARAIQTLLPNPNIIESWYDELEQSNERAPDVVIPTANERGLRARIASESNTVVLHATTSTHWQSIVHRHVSGLDDCPGCRLPASTMPSLACSSGVVETAASTMDASLPFVAGGSALQLAVLLQRLQRGELLSAPWNYCAWHWKTDNRFATSGRYACKNGCSSYLPASTRRLVNRGKWAHLDSQPVS